MSPATDHFRGQGTHWNCFIPAYGFKASNSITWLCAYCIGGNFIIHICRHLWDATLCGILSVSSLFAKAHVGVSGLQRIKKKLIKIHVLVVFYGCVQNWTCFMICALHTVIFTFPLRNFKWTFTFEMLFIDSWTDLFKPRQHTRCLGGPTSTPFNNVVC